MRWTHWTPPKQPPSSDSPRGGVPAGYGPLSTPRRSPVVARRIEVHMSGIPRNRAPKSRSGFALALAAAACAALTACQAPLPIATAADSGALPPTSRHGRPGGGDPRTTAPTSAPTSGTPTDPPSTDAPPPPTNADPNPNCTLIVPPAPLSAAGLA